MAKTALDHEMPKDRREQQIFVINDLTLKVAPTQIAVQSENLTYQYKTLRSRTSTRIPTGHGNMLAHVTIPFVNSDLLMLHRLIVEYRASPFMYIENRYLREVCTPYDWPAGKSMVFGCTNLQVQPMAGTSDAWVVDMDLVWFNYEPFGFNWLYREDWLTYPIELQEDPSIPDGIERGKWGEYGIGWQLDRITGERHPVPVIINRHDEWPEIVEQASYMDPAKAPSTRAWDLQKEEARKSGGQRTIYNMHGAHLGAEFDTLPLPGNMQPSRWVIEPKHSNVYVRYINLLQRDALYKNFGIDVEEDLKNFSFNAPDALDPWFRATNDPKTNRKRTYSLHDVGLDQRRTWINKMLETNGNVGFAYAQYIEVEFPEDIREAMHKQQTQDLLEQNARASAAYSAAAQSYDDPNGSDLALPFTGERRKITSKFGPRDGKSISSSASSFHRGMDFRGAKGSPLFSPVAGRVIYAENRERIGKTAGKYVVIRGENGEHWHFFHMNYVPWKTGWDPVDIDGRPVMVEPGTLIGQVGMTGRGKDGTPVSSGPHIHLGYSPPGVKAGFSQKENYVDPTNRLQQLLRSQTHRWWESVDSDIETLGAGTSYAQSLDLSEDQSTLTSIDPYALQQSTLKDDVQRQNGLTEEQSQSLVDFWAEMQENGWLPYIDDINLRNVWYRPLEFSIANGGRGLGEYEEAYRNDGAVVTSVSGRLSTILSRLPVLDHEYPTLQHLGSTEPTYMIEVTSVDDRPDLEGISYLGQAVTRMRSHLQANARRFRPVVDAWAVATDTFITRLFGTFHEGPAHYGGSDLMVEHIDGDPTYYRMRKRTICDFSNAGTIEGSPGLSVIQLELSETNPYLPSQLIATGPSAEDVDSDYSRILNALYNMDVKPEYKKAIATLLVADIFDLSEDPRKLRKNGTLTGAISSVWEDSSNPLLGIGADPTLQYRDDGFVIRTSPQETDLLKGLVDSFAAAQGADDTVLLPFSSLPDLAEGLSDYRELDTSLSNNVGFGALGTGLGGTLGDNLNAAATGSKFLRFSGLTVDNPELRDLDVSKLLELYNAVHDTVRHGSLYIEESDTGGVAEEVVTGLLYDLPVSPCMWQGWQEFLLEWGRQQDPWAQASTQAGATGSKALRAHDGWRTYWRNTMPTAIQKHVREIVTKNGGLFGDPIGDQSDYAWKVGLAAFTAMPFARFVQGAGIVAHVMKHGSTAATQAAMRKLFPRAAAAAAGDLTRRGAVGAGTSAAFYSLALKDLFQEPESQFITNMATAYISSFPLDVRIREGAYSFAQNTLKNLTISSDSARADEKETFDIELPNLWTDLRMHVAPTGLVSGFQINGRPVIQKPEPVNGWLSEKMSYNNVYRSDIESDKPKPYNYGPSDPAKHEPKEMIKIRRVRESLAFIAKQVKSDPQLMRVLGLDDLLALEHHKVAPGTEAYPDLILPPHPYYADAYSVSPDFYLWNMYEDGGAFKEEVRQTIQEKVDAVVERAYETFSSLRSAAPESKEKQDSVQSATQELGLEEHPALPSANGKGSYKPVFNAEGSDVQADGSGPGTPFFQKNEKVDFDSIMSSAKISNKERILSSKPQDWMRVPPRLALTESASAGGGTPNFGGAQYAFRVKPEDYAVLNEKYMSVTDMFGSREGHLNSYLTSDKSKAEDIVEKSDGTATEQLQPFEHTHAYDPGTLKKLARDSSHDMVSMKRSMRRAHPTFKFYIIEEDEQADRFIAHDDFHTYNGVKEFTVVQSRKMPADHAIITLQNIAGTLDGSRRGAIVDVDYFAQGDSSGYEQQSVRKLQEQGYSQGEAQAMSREGSSAEGTSSEQAFSSVVLRPGMNVQLRVGYSNHPDELHVLISGRVVDMQWSKTGDLAEIMVQSFGTELTQHVKGFSKSGDQRTFYTTHELLGMMMLEPEITHFGRWEFGQLFQTGEQSSAAFDVRDYSREGYQGRWGWTYSWNSWVYNHPWLFAAGTATATGALAVARKKVPWVAKGIEKWRSGRNVLNWGTAASARRISEFNRVNNTSFRKAGAEILEGFSSASRSGMWQGVKNLQLGKRTVHFISQGTQAATIIGTGTLGLDALGNGIELALNDTLGHKIRMWKRAFGIKTNMLHLSPQDDNLFPPHPKDYMRLDSPKRASIGDALESVAAFGLGLDAARVVRSATWDYFLHPERLMEKKVDPQACQYQITGSTVWDLFHEMTLRHPGWIYGVRPYGHSFEYRMFFGPPNQRYWSKPVPAEFIDRMNRLYKYIDEDGTDAAEFDSLYGEDRSREIETEVEAYQTEIWAQQGAEYWFLETDGLNRVPTGGIGESYADSAAIEAMANKERTAIAMREYLRGLNLRFVPFRRHHVITSGTDIIHNGIMGTTNASYNAVDVRYVTDARKEDADFTQSRTALIKAHSFIPDSQTRIHPISYPNCRTYEMAMRYGVGQLLHDLREMYRGEILLIGNPRMRPWDICVMIDSYNDMVGPLEVEQVVHTFSYETGFVTEIKPSMVVTANEISTWPILEGMKIFAMAVQDIESKYKDLPVSDTGLVLGARADVTSLGMALADYFPGARYNEHIRDEYKRRFGADGVTTEDFGIAYGIDPSDSLAGYLLDGVDAGGRVLGAAGIGALAYFTRGSFKRIVQGAGTWKDALGAGSVLSAAGLGAVANSYTLTPNVIWLMSGSNIFLQCLKNETIIAIPLMKNGTPIVSGLTTGDPEAMYKSFAGGINRWVEDSIEGTINLGQLWMRYGPSAWSAMNVDNDSFTWGLFNDDTVSEYGQASQ